MTRCSSGHIAQVIGVGLVGLTVVGCAGEPDESAQSPPEPSGVVSDRFELRHEVDGGDLLLAVDT